jgi:hypothetical protein
MLIFNSREPWTAFVLPLRLWSRCNMPGRSGSATSKTSRNSHYHVGQAFQPAGSRGFPAPPASHGDWKVAWTCRQECPPHALSRANYNCRKTAPPRCCLIVWPESIPNTGLAGDGPGSSPPTAPAVRVNGVNHSIPIFYAIHVRYSPGPHRGCAVYVCDTWAHPELHR